MKLLSIQPTKLLWGNLNFTFVYALTLINSEKYSYSTTLIWLENEIFLFQGFV